MWFKAGEYVLIRSAYTFKCISIDTSPLCILLTLLILLLEASNGSQYSHSICVADTGGTDNSTCLNGTIPCQTIGYALEGIPTNSTVIYVSNGVHVLKGSHNILGKSDIAIIGSDNVTINCTAGAGISFELSSNIFLDHLTFNNCGALHNSSSKNFQVVSKFIQYHVAVYISFCSNVTITSVKWSNSPSTALTMYNTVGVNVIKNCTFNNNGNGVSSNGGGGLQIEFTYCIPGHKFLCTTLFSPILIFYSMHTKYRIVDNVFWQNKAYKVINSFLYHPNRNGPRSYSFGNGGGLSIILRGHSIWNHFLISNCTFYNNVAHQGGGFYVAFHDTARHNNVLIINCNVTKNHNADVNNSLWDINAGGGGGMIHFTNEKFFMNLWNGNHVKIYGCNFTKNSAVSGGALNIKSTLFGLDAQLTISHSNFTHNSAYLGSAIFFAQKHLNDKPLQVPTISGILFTEIANSNFFRNYLLCDGQTHSDLPCTGVVYSSNFDLYMSGTLNFVDNNASALEMHSGNIIITAQTTVTFRKNSGCNGGAIALYGCSFVQINKKSKLVFEENHAKVSGGAIYVDVCDNGQTGEASNCFIEYSDNVQPNFNRNYSKVIFINNSVIPEDNIAVSTPGNAIYATIVSPCWIPHDKHSNNITIQDKQNTFCWWTYKGTNDCHDSTSINTGIAFIKFNESNVYKYPGEPLRAPVMYDGRNKSVDGILLTYRIISGMASFSLNKPEKYTQAHSDSSVRLYVPSNNDDNTTKVEVMTPKSLLLVVIIVNFKSCEWPYTLCDKSNEIATYCQCVLSDAHFCCTSLCNNPNMCAKDNQLQVWVNGEYCVTKYNNEQYIAQCPISYTDPLYADRFSNNFSNCINSSFSNRSGDFCSQCSDGYSVPINSLYLQCTQCKLFKSWILFIFLQMLPLTIMVCAIIILNIKLTTRFMYGFVFYCQMLSISYPGWFYPSWLTTPNILVDTGYIFHGFGSNVISTISWSMVLLSPWNLNFMTLTSYPICLFYNMSSLTSIAFTYIIAMYPLFLIFIILAWLKLYDKEYKCIRLITVPLHKLLARFWRMCNIEPSISNSISSIYILCFTQLAVTSFKLLKSTTRQSLKHKNVSSLASYYDASLDYFGEGHIWYCILALSVLVFLVFIPAVFITLYPFKWFQKILSCCKLQSNLWIKHLMDTFTGSFKNKDKRHIIGYQYFAGLYLMLRLVILPFYYLPLNQYRMVLYLETFSCIGAAGIIMILRPHKMNRYNFIDFILFIYMSLLSGLLVIDTNESQLQESYLYLYLAAINTPVAVFYIYCMYMLFITSVHCYQYCKGFQFLMRSRRNIQQTNSYVPIVTEDMYDSNSATNASDVETDDEFADRVLNPQDYTSVPSSNETIEEHSVYETATSGNTKDTKSSQRMRVTASLKLPSTNYGSVK